jgi:hypothetical protein
MQGFLGRAAVEKSDIGIGDRTAGVRRSRTKLSIEYRAVVRGRPLGAGSSPIAVAIARVWLSSVAKLRPVPAAVRSSMSASPVIRSTAIRCPSSRLRRSATSVNLTDRNAGRSKMLMPRKWRSSRIMAASHRHRAPRPSPDWRSGRMASAGRHDRKALQEIVQNLEIAAGTEVDEVEADPQRR